MLLSALCGAALLLWIVVRVVPQAVEQREPETTRTLYRARIWCPACQEQGQPVVLWTQVDGGFLQFREAGELAHGTNVEVLQEARSAVDGRTYVQVSTGDQTGWVPVSLIRR
jgi:hypothetical protein